MNCMICKSLEYIPTSVGWHCQTIYEMLKLQMNKDAFPGRKFGTERSRERSSSGANQNV